MCGTCKRITPSHHCGPAGSPLLVPHFLVPALDDCRYGDALSWVNKRKGIFRIKYTHKNTSNWNPELAAVFMGWDQMKGRCYPATKGYFTRARQRFKAAALKSPDLHKISCSPCKSEEIFQLRFKGGPQMKTKKPPEDGMVQVNQVSSSNYCELEIPLPHFHETPWSGPYLERSGHQLLQETPDVGNYSTAGQYNLQEPYRGSLMELMDLMNVITLESDPKYFSSVISESILYTQTHVDYQMPQ